MHELRRKMMLTVFGLLSVMMWLVTGVLGSQDYISAANSLQDSLNQIENLTHEIWRPNTFGPYRQDSSEEDASRMELLYENPVYIVLLDNSGSPVQAYYSETKGDMLEKAVDLASEIAQMDTPGSSHIGNLFTENMIWSYPDHHTVLLVDIYRVRSELISSVSMMVIIAIAFEAVLYFVCRRITDWMISPIEETFEKQKQFIADASHELKTPVAVIQANAELMEKDPNPKWLTNIEEEAVRMNGLITDLLDLTRNEQQNFQPEIVDLSRLAQKQCLIQEAVMFEHSIDFEESIDPGILVSGQPSSLEQVMAILLDNAAAHSTGTVRASLVRKGKDAVFSVSNSGDPIPEAEREKIFERFYRADASRSRQAGRYGLGLAIAKSIAEKHKGKIEVICKDGMTTFQLILRAEG